MSTTSPQDQMAAPGKFFYGWVVVAACALMIAITYGLMFSYSVFFKPLADAFIDIVSFQKIYDCFPQ